jgi:hypothetical protein
MILHWKQLELHFGPQIHQHRARFESAGETTYALLCCRYSPLEDRITSNDVDHAEGRLLNSDEWQVGITRALNSWTPGLGRIVVVLAINRSPCRDCAGLLIDALEGLQRRFPLACEYSQFILACRGLYSGRRYILGTRKNAFPRLKDAGWKQCVLQLDADLPGVGRELLREIEPVEGRGFVRLG